MGNLRVSLDSFITVGLMAFIFVWGMNYALKAAGYGQYQA
jgi:hypothetical protein